jgi:hypothetical protein
MKINFIQIGKVEIIFGTKINSKDLETPSIPSFVGFGNPKGPHSKIKIQCMLV